MSHGYRNVYKINKNKLYIPFKNITLQVLLLILRSNHIFRGCFNIIFFYRLGRNVCTIIKISEPIKSHWAKTLNLNLSELLSDGEYKEKYRLEMIKWSEEMRQKDYGCFCRLACENGNFKSLLS